MPGQDANRSPRRVDAERNIARILDVAVDALASDPDASMAEIARRAGVVRATLYAHYASREALLDAVTDRALNEAAASIDSAQPNHGDAAQALARVVSETWRTLGRYHALVAINVGEHGHDDLRNRHAPVLGRLAPLIERGQADGSFRAGVPAAWHLSMMMALIHAASGELHAGRVSIDAAEDAVVDAVLGAVSAARD